MLTPGERGEIRARRKASTSVCAPPHPIPPAGPTPNPRETNMPTPKTCTPATGTTPYLRILDGRRCADCTDHPHEIVFAEEAWGNRWRCDCCGRGLYVSIGD